MTPQAVEFLSELCRCWQIIRRRGHQISAREFVGEYIQYRHIEAAEAAGRYSDDPNETRSRTRSKRLRFMGICTKCGKQPVDYSVSLSCCTECYRRDSEMGKKRRLIRKLGSEQSPTGESYLRNSETKKGGC